MLPNQFMGDFLHIAQNSEPPQYLYPVVTLLYLASCSKHAGS